MMVLDVLEIPPKVIGIVTLSGGWRGNPRKTTLSLFKYVTIRLGRARVKGKSDNICGFFYRVPNQSSCNLHFGVSVVNKVCLTLLEATIVVVVVVIYCC